MSHNDNCPTCGRPFPGLRIHLSRRMVRRLQHVSRYGPQETDTKSLDSRLQRFGFVRICVQLGDLSKQTGATANGVSFIHGDTSAPKYLVVDAQDSKPPVPSTRLVTVAEVMGDAKLEPVGPVGEPRTRPATGNELNYRNRDGLRCVGDMS